MRIVENCSDYALGVLRLTNAIIVEDNNKRGRKREMRAWIRQGGLALVPIVDEGKIIEYSPGEFKLVKESTYVEEE